MRASYALLDEEVYLKAGKGAEILYWRNRKTTMMDFDEKINLNVNGKVGDKVNMNLNYNTQTRGKIAKIGYLLQVTEVE